MARQRQEDLVDLPGPEMPPEPRTEPPPREAPPTVALPDTPAGPTSNDKLLAWAISFAMTFFWVTVLLLIRVFTTN